MSVFNRILWALIGLLCLLAGVGGLLGAAGSLGASAASYELGFQLVAWATRSELLPAVALAAAGAVAVILGLLLLRSEVAVGPPASFGDFHLRCRDPERGRTLLRSVALRRGLEADLGRIPGVEHVGCSLLGHPQQPRLELRLEIGGDRDVRALEAAVGRSLARFATTLGASVEGGEVRLHFTRTPQQSVA